ncbi:hypothetical protein FOL47_007061, partial [Perkinsus chesapeaki]
CGHLEGIEIRLQYATNLIMAASISPPQDSLGMMQEEESLINTVADDMVASVLATSLEFDSGSDSCSIAMSHATDESIREVTPTRASLTEALAHELADEVARFAISYGQPSFMDEGVSSRESQTTIVSDSERRTTFPTPTQSISPSLASTTSVYALLRDSSRTLGAEAPGLVTEPPKQYSSRSFKSPSSQISTQRKSRRSAESIKSSSGRPMMTKLSRIVNRAKEVIVIDHFHIHHHHHLYDEGPQPGQSTQAFLSSVAEECSRRQAEAEALVHSPYFEKYAASGLIPRIDTTGATYRSVARQDSASKRSAIGTLSTRVVLRDRAVILIEDKPRSPQLGSVLPLAFVIKLRTQLRAG